MNTSLLIILFFAMAATSARADIKAAYWPSYNNPTFPPSSIDFSYFTHVYYAFLQPDSTTFRLVVPSSDATIIPNFIGACNDGNAKAILSIGGGGANATTFETIVSTAANRGMFIDSTLEVARQYGFDGIDLDWEYPKNAQQLSLLGSLFTEWRAAVEEDAKDSNQAALFLSAAVYFAADLKYLDGNDRTYPAQAIATNLDWINPMTYDFRGSWDVSQTGAPALLYDPKSNISTSYGIQSWIAAGVPAHMLVVGIPLYAHTWQLKSASNHGIGAPAVAVGPGDQGILTYSQVVDFNKNNGAVVVYDKTTVSTYSYAGTSWVGYDDTTSVSAKVTFAKTKGLGGYFFWALGDDKDWSISAAASNTWGA